MCSVAARRRSGEVPKESGTRFGVPRSTKRGTHAANDPAGRVPAEHAADQEVEVRRSTRRRRTVSAYRDGDRTIVLMPARMSTAEEQRWIGIMLQRLAGQDRRRQPSDETLAARAVELSKRYLDGRALPASARWVDNQAVRWGSCTPGDGSIRLSARLRGMPGWVVDYVLVHELSHLLVPGHGPDFWDLVGRYPRTERARGYLEGWSHARGEQSSGDHDENEPGHQGEPADDPGGAP